MALTEAPGSLGGASRPGGRARAAAARVLSLGSVPPPALIILGIISVQVGAGLAKDLFDRLPPSAVVSVRLLTS
ncbi:MAG TPA: EamA family transporter, partial [Spirillospora sp.]